jgi:hypothetical protein
VKSMKEIPARQLTYVCMYLGTMYIIASLFYFFRREHKYIRTYRSLNFFSVWTIFWKKFPASTTCIQGDQMFFLWKKSPKRSPTHISSNQMRNFFKFKNSSNSATYICPKLASNFNGENPPNLVTLPTPKYCLRFGIHSNRIVPSAACTKHESTTYSASIWSQSYDRELQRQRCKNLQCC